MKKLIILLAVLIALSACSVRNFKTNVSVTTKNGVPAKILGPVTAERCNVMILGFGIPFDPADMYDELLEKAQSAGGNAVVDFQSRTKDMFAIYPLFISDCWEAIGQAAVVE